MRFKHFKKTKTITGVISLILAFISFIISLCVMIFYYKTGYTELSSTILLPLLLTTVVVISVASVTAFLSLGSKYGKFVFLINFCAVAFVIATFIKLYQ